MNRKLHVLWCVVHCVFLCMLTICIYNRRALDNQLCVCVYAVFIFSICNKIAKYFLFNAAVIFLNKWIDNLNWIKSQTFNAFEIMFILTNTKTVCVYICETVIFENNWIHKLNCSMKCSPTVCNFICIESNSSMVLKPIHLETKGVDHRTKEN